LAGPYNHPVPRTLGKQTWQSKKGAQPLQALVDGCLEPSLKAKGFASSAIHLHWAEIVGAALAPWSEPITMKWPVTPPGADQSLPKAGAALTIKVEGAFALDIQHQAPQIMERVNSFFGWRCVERIIIKQGAVRKLAPPQKKPRKTLTVKSSQDLDTMLEKIDDPILKATLARLGVGVMSRK
jgi:hypothetical protein